MTATASPCPTTGTATGTTTTSNDQADTTTTTSSSDQMGPGTGTTNSGAMTVTATGVHLVFTQPVSPPGVPAQYVEHILGEVFVDSLAVPAGPLPDLGFSSSSFSSFSSSSPCLGGGNSRGTTSGVASAGGISSAGGSGSLSSSGSTFGSSSQANGSTGTSLPAAFAAALRKPLWLLLAYLLWQTLVIGTGWSLWNWRRDGAS
jgi:hypothetical protein